MTRNDYMRALARRLRWKCGRQEAAGILAEYRQSFEAGLARGKSEEALCEAFGTPSAAAEALLRESGTPFIALPWVRMLLVAAAAFLVVLRDSWSFFRWNGGVEYLLILAMSVALYFVAGGPELRRMKKPAPCGRGAKLLLAGLCFGAVLCAAFIFFTVYHLDGVYRLYLRFMDMIHDDGIWRNLVNGALFKAAFLMTVLMAAAWLWALRVAPGGKWLFPSGAIAVSLAVAVRNLDLLTMSGLLSDGDMILGALAADLLLGLVMALLLALTLPGSRADMEETEETPGRVERIAALTREPVCGLFLDALSRHLTLRFSREEKREILEDYAECFMAGMEEGRSAAALCGEFGSPEAVAEILCRERRGGFLPRPAAKLGAALLLAGVFSVLYTYAYDRLTYFTVLKYGFWLLLILAAPFLLSLIAWGEPAARRKKLTLPLTLMYLFAVFTLAVPPLIMASILYDWPDFPIYSGPIAMGLLYMGLSAVGAATVLELRTLPRQWRLPPMFVNVGYVAANAHLVWLLGQLSDPVEALTVCMEALIPLTLGLILALLCGGITKHMQSRGGFGGGVILCRPRKSRRERIDRVKRISARTVGLECGELL